MQVLIIDDNPAVGTALEVLLALQGIESRTARSPEEGLAALRKADFGLVIQDMNFSGSATSGEEGRELFHALREFDSELPVILLTAWTHLDQAVELVKAGAADYLAKPWDDQKLLTTVENLLRIREERAEDRRCALDQTAARRRLQERFDLCGLIYESEVMHRVVQLATRVAEAEVPVLITGPNGSGKEKLAEIVQANSQRAAGPFVRVNLGALPVELLESELFGAEAGAYTGSQRSREGRFEAADGGTLFLDEIGEMPLAGQVKLLRVLQSGELERLGSTRTRRVSVRVISATHRDLASAVASGVFREDLYYRLNVIELRSPALCDRKPDILPIARSFLPPGKRLAKAAEKALLTYDWPGNVRELHNRIQRATILSPGEEVEAAAFDLPEAPPVALRSRTRRREPGREEVLEALERVGWVISHAAEELGLSRQALYRRMEKLGIERGA